MFGQTEVTWLNKKIMNLNKLLGLLFLIIIVSCNNNHKEATVVDFADTISNEHNISLNTEREVYIAIASMTSPKETYIYYNDLINYISDKVGYPIYIKQKKTYEEVNLLLENSEVDFAFICSGAFVDEYERGKIKILVAPEIDNKLSYNAYIISHKDLGKERFQDFENGSFAFTDPLSNTGRFYPLKKLSLLNKSESEFFRKTIFTYGHDISIQMVNRGIIDGASVHGLIYEYLATYYPKRVENIEVVEKSEDYGIPPVVTPVSLSKEYYEDYQRVFMNIHKDSVGRKILEKLNIDRFVIVGDDIYKSVIELKETVDNVESK